MSTNYTNTFMAISPDCRAARGTAPPKPGTIAAIQFALLRGAPYGLTSDDLLFLTHAERHGLPPGERDAARAAFFARPQACLRTSPLVRQFGWGLHHDGEGRVALYGCETARYAELAADPGLRVIAGLRSRRG